MVWQDFAIGLANIVLLVSIIPQIQHGFKEKKAFILLKTSIPTTLGLFVMVIAFFTLQLYFSAIIGTINVCLWSSLIAQRLIYSKA